MNARRFVKNYDLVRNSHELALEVLVELAEHHLDLFNTIVEDLTTDPEMVKTHVGDLPLRSIRDQYVNDRIDGTKADFVALVKEIRHETGLSLKDAKEVAEDFDLYAVELGAEPRLRPGRR